jgi:carbamoyl-phosphate synthase small subunit
VNQNLPALIALEDGTVFEGTSFTGPGTACGELVFNTSMTGYQEILTDPSYHGQIVTMTYPLIGNYGINDEDVESSQPHAAGFVVSECSRIVSNWRSTKSLPDYLREHGRLGIHQVDTRAITFHIRSRGAMKCIMSTEDLDRESLVARARASAGLVGRDLASEVSTPEPSQWAPRSDAAPFRVVAFDCGIKTNQLRILSDLGCEVNVVPIGTPSETVARNFISAALIGSWA